jgi:hypothetical protein
MKRVYELNVYKLAEELSDMVWHDFDKWNKFPISTFRERLRFFDYLQGTEGFIPFGAT